ncbi:glycosyl transferase family 1 [Burkholderia singularis]|uniref:Glycosyl transferase family 1 n=1 Tax=Burkholderia singularis TaxID=1503053 RepID=A0A103E6U8_9BURK|nr:glycosyltransferase [Burkholderia singularis]KVE29460.1 glycosyl transferase family 1 [Burkholderia singularis]
MSGRLHVEAAERADAAAQAAPARGHARIAQRAGRRLRVALVVEAAGGGVAVHVADLIDGLAAAGVEVHLIGPTGARFDTSILHDAILRRCTSVVRVPMQRAVSWRDARAYVDVFRALARIEPDIVHSHSSKAGVLARACIGAWRHVYTPHAFYTLNPYLSPGSRWLYGSIETLFGKWRTDRVIAVSDDEARHATGSLRIPARAVRTIHNGVPGFALLSREAARAALGIAGDAFTVGFVGRFSFQKGVDRLVAAAARLDERYGARLQIAVIGIGDFAAQAGCGAAALSANLKLIGRVQDARRYFSAFDAFVLPSRYEGFPYVYLEAMAARLPVVTTRVAGADEVVGRHGVGIVVDNVDDPAALAGALGTLFEDGAARARMAANCTRAIAHFSASGMVRRTLELYHDVLNGGSR